MQKTNNLLIGISLLLVYDFFYFREKTPTESSKPPFGCMSLVPLVPLVQGWTKITFPGCVSMGLNNCVYLPATGAEKVIVSSHIHRTWEGYFSPALYNR